MDEEMDGFEFVLAEQLGMTIARLRAEMPHNEYVAWRAFAVYRAGQIELARKEPT